MRPRISIRGSVRRSVDRSVRRSVRPSRFHKNNWKSTFFFSFHQEIMSSCMKTHRCAHNPVFSPSLLSISTSSRKHQNKTLNLFQFRRIGPNNTFSFHIASPLRNRDRPRSSALWIIAHVISLNCNNNNPNCCVERRFLVFPWGFFFSFRIPVCNRNHLNACRAGVGRCKREIGAIFKN